MAKSKEITAKDGSLMDAFELAAESHDVAKVAEILWLTCDDMAMVDSVFLSASANLDPTDLLRAARILKDSEVFQIIDKYTGWANDIRRKLEDRMPKEDLISYKNLKL